MRNTIRIQRAYREITQQELADALNVARQTINAIEIRRYMPSTKLAMKIARYFNKPVEEVFILEEDD